MKRCNRCLGTKEVYGMGSVKEKCPDCNGQGFMKEQEIDLTEVTAKRGRPKKELSIQ